MKGARALVALALTGCPAAPSDPPPPPNKPEIVPAPPRALGARAAGTDAAPSPDGMVSGSAPLLPSPSPFVPDAGAPTPQQEPDGGSASTPDAGMPL